MTGIYTRHLRTLLDGVGKERFAKEWFSDSWQRHRDDWLRERSYQEFGLVDKWTKIREIRIGNLRWLLGDFQLGYCLRCPGSVEVYGRALRIADLVCVGV